MSTSSNPNYTFINGSKSVPLFDKRKQFLEESLSNLSIKPENEATYPVVSGSNSNPQVARLDPTTGQTLAKIQNATWEQVDQILERSVQVQKKWAKASGDQRVKVVLEMNEAIRAHQEALARLETFEIGKIPTESMGELIEIYDVADVIKERAAEVGGSKPYFTRQYESREQKRRELGWKGEERQLPLGVLGKMTAFNFPYAVYCWGSLPALAAGNSVVLKPHPDSSLTSLALVKIMADVAKKNGFDGLVSVVFLSDWDISQRLWKDERINAWEVTGSEAMGKAFVSQVGPTFKRICLELGGNNCVIVHKDCKLANAVESCLFGATGTAGQRCTSTRIIYVHDSIFDKFSESFKEGFQKKLHIGDPFQPGVNVGPVHHKRQVENFENSVKHYLSSGSKLLVGGQVISGNFVEPTAFVAPTLRYDALLEEKFVPLVHLVRYKDNELETVIDEINRSGYGLSGGIFTADESVFSQCVENIKVGIFNLNYGSSGAEAGENFGGEGKTGGGRMLGPGMFRHYTRYINSMKSPLDSAIVHAQNVQVSVDV